MINVEQDLEFRELWKNCRDEGFTRENVVSEVAKWAAAIERISEEVARLIQLENDTREMHDVTVAILAFWPEGVGGDAGACNYR